MADRIKVVEVLWHGRYGGAERHVFDLATALDRSRYEVTVCFLSDGGVYPEKLERAGILTQSFHLQNGRDVAGIGRFSKWLKTQDLDIVHDHASAPWTTTVAGLSTQAKVVWTIHGSQHQFRNLAEKLKYWAFLRLSRPYVDVYVAVSRYTKDQLVSFGRLPDDRVEVIYNSVDLERFQPVDDKRAMAIRRELNLPATSRIIGTVSRLNVTKRIDFLIDVAAELLGDGFDLWLVIVGGGRLEGELRKRVESLGISSRVIFLGTRGDIPSILAVLDVFVFASTQDTFGIAVAEAMAMARPVVALRSGGVPEVIGENGVAGFLCEPGSSPSEFAQMVKTLLQDPSLSEKIGLAARERIEKNFSDKLAIAEMENLYSTLV